MNLLKAPRDEFLKVLQLVTGIVERRHTLPILANVLLKKQGREIGLTSSDLEIQIRTQAEFDGDAGQVSTLSRRENCSIFCAACPKISR
jgi:DNA polymerase III subunit beta